MSAGGLYYGMTLKIVMLCIVVLFAYRFASAQSQYSIPTCTSSSAARQVGGRIKLQLPKDAILTKGQDVDYSNYAIGFGPAKSRVWLEGIYGPTATSGTVPDDWLAASVGVTRRVWSFAELKGVDAKGKLANGNYWRYLGHLGESIKYHDVGSDAAAYFDSIIDRACFHDWRNNPR